MGEKSLMGMVFLFGKIFLNFVVMVSQLWVHTKNYTLLKGVYIIKLHFSTTVKIKDCWKGTHVFLKGVGSHPHSKALHEINLKLKGLGVLGRKQKKEKRSIYTAEYHN